MVVIEKQTLLDLAIQGTGTAASSMELAIANGLSLSDDLVPGSDVTVNDDITSDKDVLSYIKSYGMRPASNDFHDFNDDEEGIGYWILEDDFIVQ